MKIIDAYRISRANLFRARARSFLTIAGVAVGVGAIILLVSLGIGLQRLTVNQIATLDILTTLTVTSPDSTRVELNSEAIKKVQELKNVESTSPSVKYPAQFTYNGTTTSSLIQGIQSENLSLEQVELETGRNFLDGSEELIISKSLLKTLGEEDCGKALDKKINIKIFVVDDEEADITESSKQVEKEFTVVGVDKSEAIGMGYISLDWLSQEAEIDKTQTLKVKVKNRKDIDSVRQEIEGMGFEVSTISDLINQIDTVFLVFEVILGLIGGIGLFVASIGIINTMTIALLERTHEVGVMRAVGARKKDVKRLFVYEALQIAFFGGLFGIIAGIALGSLFDLIINLMIKASGGLQDMNLFITPPLFALGMILFSIFIGWLVGLYPARRAAKLSPLEALHIE